MRAIEYIVLHHAAAYDAKANAVVYQDVHSIRRYHVEHNGWRDVGYHWVVCEDGLGQRGRADTDVGAHTGGFNIGSLGLCVAGHADFVPWNDAQIAEVLRKCAQWCGMYRIPVENVIGHREAPERGAPPVHKTCPGILTDMGKIREALRMRLESSS